MALDSTLLLSGERSERANPIIILVRDKLFSLGSCLYCVSYRNKRGSFNQSNRQRDSFKLLTHTRMIDETRRWILELYRSIGFQVEGGYSCSPYIIFRVLSHRKPLTSNCMVSVYVILTSHIRIHKLSIHSSAYLSLYVH